MRSTNDDVGYGGSDSDFDTRIAFLRKFALEELVQFGVEYTVCKSKSCQRVVPLGSLRRAKSIPCGEIWNLPATNFFRLDLIPSAAMVEV